MKFVGSAHRRREAEGSGEQLGPLKIGFLELEPGQVVHLDDRVARPTRVLARQRTLLTVQTSVRVMPVDHVTAPFKDLTKSSLTIIASVKSR
jgi:hypothetical protein